MAGRWTLIGRASDIAGLTSLIPTGVWLFFAATTVGTILLKWILSFVSGVEPLWLWTAACMMTACTVGTLAGLKYLRKRDRPAAMSTSSRPGLDAFRNLIEEDKRRPSGVIARLVSADLSQLARELNPCIDFRLQVFNGLVWPVAIDKVTEGRIMYRDVTLHGAPELDYVTGRNAIPHAVQHEFVLRLWLSDREGAHLWQSGMINANEHSLLFDFTNLTIWGQIESGEPQPTRFRLHLEHYSVPKP